MLRLPESNQYAASNEPAIICSVPLYFLLYFFPLLWPVHIDSPIFVPIPIFYPIFFPIHWLVCSIEGGGTLLPIPIQIKNRICREPISF